MKSILFTLIIFLTIAALKSREDEPGNLPECIQKKIEVLKKDPQWDASTEVKEYVYQGKKIFYFSSECCEESNFIVDENCNFICNNKSQSKTSPGCSDLLSHAKETGLVWKE